MTRRSISEVYREVGDAKRHEMAELRGLVLADRELAHRLTKLPWPYSSPDQWTGHIPPYLYDGRRNDSPQRAALVALCREAIARAHGEETAAVWLKATNHDVDEPRWTATAVTDGS